jgi:hypothetical protein
MLTLLFLLLMQTPAVQTTAFSIDGVYNGTYICMATPTAFKLSLTLARDGSLAGVFTFYPKRMAPREFAFDLSGTYDAASRRFQLQPTKWETIEYLVMIPLQGTFEPAGGAGAGQVQGQVLLNGCRSFDALRDRDESARIDRVIAAQKAGTTGAPAPTTASNPPQAGGKPTASGAPQVTNGPFPGRRVGQDDGTTTTVPTPKAGPASKPGDPEWMKHVRLRQPDFVRALATGDFAPLRASPIDALAYIGTMNDEFIHLCPGVFSAIVTEKAGLAVADGSLQMMQRGEPNLFQRINRVREIGESAKPDVALIVSEILVESHSVDPDVVCAHEATRTLARFMQQFVNVQTSR